MVNRSLSGISLNLWRTARKDMSVNILHVLGGLGEPLGAGRCQGDPCKTLLKTRLVVKYGTRMVHDGTAVRGRILDSERPLMRVYLKCELSRLTSGRKWNSKHGGLFL